jgi:hypothetical protein
MCIVSVLKCHSSNCVISPLVCTLVYAILSTIFCCCCPSTSLLVTCRTNIYILLILAGILNKVSVFLWLRKVILGTPPAAHALPLLTCLTMGPERSRNKTESFTIVKRILFLLLLLVSFIPLYTSSKYLYLHPTTTTTTITQTTGLHQSLASFQTTKNHKNNNNNENNDLYSLAKAQSFGFFEDISTSHWNRLHQIYVEHENHRHPDKPFTAHADATREEFDPEVWKQREQISQQWKSVFMSDTAWYQNVSLHIMHYFVIIPRAIYFTFP